ncbi:MAG: exodeoxyribonuclease III [Kiritimatiellae bacterium]|nr:exodeoxyribonuclease III [Kiritimatiellia bacterium]
MKIATFNANSIRSRLPIILDWLAREQPDVLCVQETKVQDHDFPQQPFRDAGYRVVFRGEKSYNGVAIVSRREPEEVVFGLDDGGPRDETRLARAAIGPVTIVNTYVPQGREVGHPMFAYKLEWFRRLRRYLDKSFSEKDLLLWAGDLNVAAEPADVHNPDQQGNHVCFHADARAAFADCRAWGFVDVFRKHHPEPNQYSFFDYRMPRSLDRNLGWRLDYLLASEPLAAQSVDCRIDLEPRRLPKPSDHTFVVAEFKV